MHRQLVPALRILAVLTVLCGIAYPLVATGVAQAAFGDRADGSLLRDADGDVVGSSLLGQAFEGDEWFWPRPSAAGDGYDGSASSPSNLGPTNPELLAAVAERIAAYGQANGLAPDASVPVDAVTASGSGLDPHISVANARLQAPRVAETRDLPLDDVLALVDDHTDGRSLGFLGEPGVNVVTLNLALAERG
ncbi:MAG: K(+)-transporting ATPase subunit C [Acidimicrobiales bacterium]|nr:K(+)-transporting ATPase subunit C [Acidimicrobiales bacterium]HRW36665.1 K(+)-transporting ATPase subunit C [Aquihabitans sp.]